MMDKRLTDMKLNEKIKTKEAMPGFESIMGDNMKLVGVTYSLLGDSGVVQDVRAWAKGFNHEKYYD